MTQGPVGKNLFKLTVPMMGGIYSFMLFNFVDAMYLGRLGALQLAAVSFTFPVALVVSSFGQGIGVGASAIISRAIGEQDESNVRRITTDTLLLSLLGALVFTGLGFLTIEPLFRVLGATSEVMPYIREYMVLWYLGVPFIIIPLVGNNAIRATGDTRTPAIIMISSAAANAILDPLLIFGPWVFPELGVTGAALASLLARAGTLLIGVWVIGYRERLITLARPAISVILDSWRQILFIGLPAAGTNLLLPVSMAIITAMVAVFGPGPVAALGAGTRITGLAVGVFIATSAVVTPFIGQNIGAGHSQRAQLAVLRAQQFVSVWGVIVFVVLGLFATQIAPLFNDESSVIDPLVHYLRIVPFSAAAFGVILVSGAALNAYKRPLHAAALTIVRLIALIIMAALGSALMGLDGIFAAIVLSDVLGAIASYLWLRRIMISENPTTDLSLFPPRSAGRIGG
jgi:putative MATE family efflux protein